MWVPVFAMDIWRRSNRSEGMPATSYAERGLFQGTILQEYLCVIDL